MPRSLVLGNGRMLVNLDQNALMRELYFPQVGLEDHMTGHVQRIGIFENGNFTWLGDDHWDSKVSYLAETMMGDSEMVSKKWGLRLKFHDFVTPDLDLFCRKIEIENLRDQEREIKVFFHYDFYLYGAKSNDTVFYAPGHHALVFYNRNRYFLVNASKSRGIIDQFATGKTNYKGLEGTWKDAEDGHLAGNPITQGSVDATFGLDLKLKAGKSEELSAWVAAGKTADEVYDLNIKVKKIGFNKLERDTKNYWYKWVNKRRFNFEGIDERTIKLFKHSLLIVRTQIDNEGAIIAANDSDITRFNKDTYSYMWPRDGALVAMAMDKAGYSEVTENFFRFCAHAQRDEGYLLHKYNADGSPGSSWHPWIYEDCPQSPLQEDETALPLLALWNHYKQVPNIEFLHYMYDDFVKGAADFLVDYRDPETKLPLPSYDLWEEHKGVFTFSVAATYGALDAAEKICSALGSTVHRAKYAQAAQEVKAAALKHLYNEEAGRFVKALGDDTVDASIAGVFLFGLLPADDERVVSTMKQFPQKIGVKNIGGLARYENDYYQRTADYPADVPGNPWIITSLWYAQWCLQMSQQHNDKYFKEAISYINWSTDQATASSILPEQVDALNGEPLSVAPLTWSHATYVDTILVLQKTLARFGKISGDLVERME